MRPTTESQQIHPTQLLLGSALNDMRRARANLAHWSTPSEFVNLVEKLEQQIENSDYFRSPAFKFLRDDAWILAQFSVLIQASRVRLANESEQFPDGHVEVSGEFLPIEITEADRPGRRRSDEYKPDAPRVTCRVINNADGVGNALEQAIKRKLAKNYAPPPPTLVVHLNLGVHGRKNEEAKLDLLIANIKQKYAPSFSGIYVLRNDRLM